jgi:predicted ATPase
LDVTTPADFGHLVRDALAHLHDPVHLQTHPLARYLPPAPTIRAGRTGQVLGQALIEAIEELRPATGNEAGGRGYEILRLRYVEALAVPDILRRLAIGRSHFYREHQRSLDGFASLLRERWQLTASSRPADSADRRRERLGAPTPAEVARHNLPASLTSFVGRQSETAEVRRLLATTRLLTLTGTGGCGKTRLALEVAAELIEEYPDGVWLVELAALTDPGLVAQAVASVLDLVEQPGERLVQSLVGILRHRSTLLVLDNCEHLLDAVACLAEDLLRGCPTLRILATSRESLGITGEVSYRIPSLSVPPLDETALPDLDHLARFDAVRLFSDRASAARPGLRLSVVNAAAVVRICTRLDGLPLAIELAAARLRALSLQDIDERLDDLFRLLTGGSRTALPRHQTLSALVGWSYGLLSEPEQTLFNRLAVFAGGCTLEAAEAVCADLPTAPSRRSDAELAGWIERERRSNRADETGSRGGDPASPGSVVTTRGDPEIWPSLRSRDETRVRAGEVFDLLARLVEKSLVVKEETTPGAVRYRLPETLRQYARERLTEVGEAESFRQRQADYFVARIEAIGLEEPEQDVLYSLEQWRWMESEHDNLRAALRWLCDRDNLADGLRLASLLTRFWVHHGFLSEGRAWLEELLRLPGATEPTRRRATALRSLYHLVRRQTDYATARALVEETLVIHRHLNEVAEVARSLLALGAVAFLAGDFDQALTHLREAEELIEGGVGQADPWSRRWHRLFRAWVRVSTGNEAAARADLESVLDELEAKDSLFACYVHSAMGLAALGEGDQRGAREHFRTALGIGSRFGDLTLVAGALEGLAGLAAARGQNERAARLVGAADARRQAIGAPNGPAWGDFLARQVRPAREALGDEWANAFKEGQAMSLEQAMDDALAADEPAE